MATVEKTVNIIFGGENRLSNVVSGVDRDFNKLGKSISSVTAPLSNMVDLVLIADAAIVALGGAMIAFSIGAAKKAEDALIELNKVMDVDASDQQQAQIKALALAYGELASETTLAVAEFRRSGFDFDESLGLTEVSLKAFNATELETAEASELLKRTIAGMGQNFEDSDKTITNAARIMEVWNNASNIANTTVGEVGESFKRLAPLVDIAGFSFEETTALSVALIESFGEGSEVSRGLVTAFTRLATPTALVSKALADLGVSTKDSNGAQKSARDILFEVADAWQDVDKNSRLGLAAQIAGRDQSAKFAKVMEGFNRVLELNNELKKDTSTLDEELAKRMDALSFKTRVLKTSFSSLGVSIGNEFLDNAKGSVTSLSNLAQAFDKVIASGGLKPLFDAMQPVFGTFNTNIDAIAANLEEAFKGVDFGGLVDAMGDLGTEISGLFDGVDLTTTEGLTKAIQKIIDLGEIFIGVNAGIVESFGPMVAAIGSAINEISQLDGGAGKAFGNLIGVAKQVELISPSITKLTGAVSGLTAVVTGVGLASLGKAFGKAGLAGGIAVAAIALNDFINSFEEGEKVLSSIGSTVGGGLFDLFDDFDPNADNPLSKLDADARDAAAGMAETEQQLKDIVTELDAIGTATTGGIFDFEFDEFAFDDFESIDAFGNAVQRVGDVAQVATSEVRDLSNISADGLEVAGAKFVKTWEDGIPVFTQVGEVLSTSLAKAGDAADDATKKTESFQLKLLEISSDERIEFKKLDVEFDIAKIKADADIVGSIFDSIGDGIESTGNLIGSLIGDLDGASARTRSEIESQIRKENEFRKKEFELQEKSINAINRDRRERTRLAAQGVELHFDGGALEARAAAMLQVLLKDSRTFMNDNGANALLGCSGGT